MSLLKDFKEFATRGNVVDLAVGVIIGGAFGKIVSSLVEDILMPPIGYLIGGINFTEIKITLIPAQLNAAGIIQKAAITLNIGKFLQSFVDFLIIAFAIFLVVKIVNMLHKKEAAPAKKAEEVLLLTEIRNLLRKKR